MDRKSLENLRNRAKGAVHLAIKNGKLKKLDGSIECKDCGAPATEYDHRDYTKPLQVDPVCDWCNKQRGQGYPKMPKTNHDQVMKKYHERNTKIVQAYLRGVAKAASGKSPGKDTPVKIRKRFKITSRARFYQILKAYKVTANYVKYTRKR